MGKITEQIWRENIDCNPIANIPCCYPCLIDELRYKDILSYTPVSSLIFILYFDIGPTDDYDFSTEELISALVTQVIIAGISVIWLYRHFYFIVRNFVVTRMYTVKSIRCQGKVKDAVHVTNITASHMSAGK